MTKVRSVIIMFMLVSISFPLVSDAYAHSMFNSAEEFLGGYRVQVATLPEFPQIGEKSQILFRVGDSEFNEVDQFTMGVRFFIMINKLMQSIQSYTKEVIMKQIMFGKIQEII